MDLDDRGYCTRLAGGWLLTVSMLEHETVIWLTHNQLDNGFYEGTVVGDILIDLETRGYVPSVYHEGGERSPLVLFHPARRDLPAYVWEPVSGRFYRAGEGGYA